MLSFLDRARPVHFIGVGGASMSGLALMLHHLGYQVTGSDLHDSPNLREAAQAGLVVVIGHHRTNLGPDTQLVVTTSASIPADNPELLQAREAGIPVVDRAKLLGSFMSEHGKGIAIAGTRGKTTTTSAVARMTEACGLDPAVSVGTGVAARGGNFRIGAGEYFVAEACEYHRAFLNMTPYAAIVLNIEPDHGDYFTDLDDATRAFHTFTERVQPGGVLLASADCPRARLLKAPQGVRRVTFGFSEDADYRIQTRVWANGFPEFQVAHRGRSSEAISAHLAGRHNIGNLTAAYALARELDLPMDRVMLALESFTGAPRRLQYHGTRNGIRVYDDIACTPGEITATMSALRGLAGGAKITAVLRPNSYTRVRDYIDQYAAAFTDAEVIILTGIYPGRDTQTFGMQPADLVREFQKLGRAVRYFPDNHSRPDTTAITEYLHRSLYSGDVLVTIGPQDLADLGPQWLTWQRDPEQHELAG